MPFGIQMVAAPGREASLIAFGRHIERELGFTHRPAPL
jgi:amidase